MERMGLYETIKIPFRWINGHQCLTAHQLVEQPKLREFVDKFTENFAYDGKVYWFYRNGKPHQ